MEELVAVVATAQQTLETVAGTVRADGWNTVADLLLSATPHFRHIQEDPVGSSSSLAAFAVDIIYSAKRLVNHPAIALARNSAHDVLHAGPHQH